MSLSRSYHPLALNAPDIIHALSSRVGWEARDGYARPQSCGAAGPPAGVGERVGGGRGLARLVFQTGGRSHWNWNSLEDKVGSLRSRSAECATFVESFDTSPPPPAMAQWVVPVYPSGGLAACAPCIGGVNQSLRRRPHEQIFGRFWRCSMAVLLLGGNPLHCVLLAVLFVSSFLDTSHTRLLSFFLFLTPPPPPLCFTTDSVGFGGGGKARSTPSPRPLLAYTVVVVVPW